MAAYKIELDGKVIQIACQSCGSTNLFAHTAKLLTCNKCGNTFETAIAVEFLPEEVVKTLE